MSFGIGEIIPSHILKTFSLAINIHAASPDYPGRDPHHFAAYDKVDIYGATAHLMEARVDCGTIVDIELIKLTEPKDAMQLLTLANECGYKILNRLLKNILIDKKIPKPLQITWSGKKRRRKHLIELSAISPYSSKSEIDHKYDAFQKNISHNNLFLDLYNYRFRYEKKLNSTVQNNDFTEHKYKEYLIKLIENYKFSFFSKDYTSHATVLLRHDIDVSVHRAYKLAKIETALGIKSTFFIMLYNWFYDIRDPEIRNLIFAIKKMGHKIGLHFDASYPLNTNFIDKETLAKTILQQKIGLETILSLKITIFSYHNPTILGNNLIKDLEICGMLNVYNETFIKNFKYCSDSNGLWRFDKLDDLIKPKQYPKLHVLIHPEWWTPEPLTPRKKILRALNGRANAMLSRYDKLLYENKRLNS
ncbi:MAG: formyltransferase family protein [Rickettsiella sp.]|nr:formyltransferase family protein [Rickettsiella sp.]